MKKVFALVLALVLVCSMATVAMAEGPVAVTDKTVVVTPSINCVNPGFIKVSISATSFAPVLKVTVTPDDTDTYKYVMTTDSGSAFTVTNNSIGAANDAGNTFDGKLLITGDLASSGQGTYIQAGLTGHDSNTAVNVGANQQMTLTYTQNATKWTWNQATQSTDISTEVGRLAATVTLNIAPYTAG